LKILYTQNEKLTKNWWLVGIISIGVLLRIVAAFYLGDKLEVFPGIFDQLSYDRLARNLLAGNGFSMDIDWWPATQAGEPTAHWSYFMTLFLYAVYSIFGYHPLVARLIQAVLGGVLMPLLVYRISKRCFTPNYESASMTSYILPLLTAAWVSFYGYFIYYAAALMSETFFMVLILWTIDCAIRIIDQIKNQDSSVNSDALMWIELGLAAGITAIIRQTFVIFIPFMLGWIWWGVCIKRNLKPNNNIARFLKGSLISMILVVSIILPFTVYNYQRFDRFVLLNTNSGYVFFWSNHPIHGKKFVPLFTPEMPSYKDLIPDELLQLDEAALDQALLKRGVQFVKDDPIRYLILSLSRIPEHFIFWPLAASHPVSNLTRVGSLGIALPFGMIGIGYWVSNLRKKAFSFPEARLLLVLFYIIYNGIHIATWAGIRYRLPTDPILIMFSAFGLYNIAMKIPLLNQKFGRESI